MAKAPREIELKFVLPRQKLAALTADLPGLAEAGRRALGSSYFDTDKRLLRAAGLSLRVRREGGRYVQTVKRGAAGLSRGEWECEVAGGAPDVGALMKTPAAGALKSRPRLKQLFSVEVVRRSSQIEDGDSRIELSLDDGEIRAGARRAAFAELELELKAGSLEALFALARRLVAAHDLTLSFSAKSDRGFVLLHAARTRAVRFSPPAIDGNIGAGEAFRAVARAGLTQISANAEQLRERASPEVVHQLRVGLRRLRSLFTTFKPLVADARLPALQAELKWLTGELDGARNLDVLLQGDYRAALAEHQDAKGLKDLGARLRGQRRLAYARAAAAVESERFRRLLLDILVWTETGPWTARNAPHADRRDRSIRRFAADALDKRRRNIVRRGKRLGALDAETRHKLRIDAKKLRYAADAFAGLYGHPKRAKNFIEALKGLQDTLGRLNDIAVGQNLTHDVAAAAGWADAEAAYVAGRITGVQKASAAPLIGAAEKAFAAFADARPFWPD